MTLVGCSGTISRRWRAAWLRLLLAFMLLQLTRPILLRAQFLLVTNGEAIGIAGYTGPGGVVTIPRSTNGLPVTRILSHAFTNHPALISVAIPSSVTNCAVYAFLN